MAGQRRRAGNSTGSAEQEARLEYASGAGFLLRLFWMAFGNLLLLYLAGSIMRDSVWALSSRDLAYWLTVVALVVARYVDVARYEGLTISSEPATQAHVRRYAVGLFVIAMFVWAGAQSIKL